MPGQSEDLTGLPFQGVAGKMLNKIIEATGYVRGEDICIANAVCCRPPGNRTPSQEEIDRCSGKYLKELVNILQPKGILCVGLTPARAFIPLDKNATMGDIRGKLFTYDRTYPLVITYHPAYLVYNQGPKLPEIKKKVWADVSVLFEAMHLPLPKGD